MPIFDDEHDEVYYSDEEDALYDVKCDMRSYFDQCEDNNVQPDINQFMKLYNYSSVDEDLFWDEYVK